MSADALVRRRIAEHLDVAQAMATDAELLATAGAAAEILTGALLAGRKALFCGNGGSACDATHLAAELVGRFCLERESLAALSLSDNGAAVTAIANDYDFADVFARQVRGLGQPGDVLVALSTSGGSPNVLAAVEAADARGLRTVAITGRSGGRLAELAEVCVRVPSDDTARVQEGTILVGHVVCELVEQATCAPARIR